MDLIGTDAAQMLRREFGGIGIPVPAPRGQSAHSTREGALRSRLVQVIGADATEALCRVFGGSGVIYVPKLGRAAQARFERNRAIVAAYEGRSQRGEVGVVAGLAREHDISVRQVWTILKTTV